MLIPCARSAQSATVGERVHVLVHVDRERRLALELARRPGRPPAAAAPRTRRRAPASSPDGLERLVELPVLVDVDLERQVGDCRARRAPARRRARRGRRASASAGGSAGRPRSARRAMSSGSPSQTVHEVGGPPRSRPSSCQTGWPTSFPQRSWSAASTAAFAAWLPGAPRAGVPIASSANGSSPSSARRLVQERLGALDALAVVVLRLRLAEARDAVVLELDPEDVLLDAGLAGDA